MLKKFLAAAVWISLSATTSAFAETFVLDLTHPIPTFKPMEGDPMKPDTNQPWGDSVPIPSFAGQAILSFSDFPTNQGKFEVGRLILGEHHGTHLDSPAHYANNDASMEPGGTPPKDRKRTHQLDANDLTGPVVLIDISGRVETELAKNGGKPSPDKGVTDFSESSPNVVTADDIGAVADQLDDGVWLVLNTAWSKFFFQGADFAKDPYINGWNHPGISHGAVDKLIELMDKKNIKVSGIVADNIGVDSGESARGEDDKWTNSWYAHVRLLQRGVKLVENAANLGQLAMAKPGSCTLVVGAPKHVRGAGGPSRVIAMCEK
ncbi:MAG: cyclase family protein [Gammaproteobacteria bacterium]